MTRMSRKEAMKYLGNVRTHCPDNGCRIEDCKENSCAECWEQFLFRPSNSTPESEPEPEPISDVEVKMSTRSHITAEGRSPAVEVCESRPAGNVRITRGQSVFIDRREIPAVIAALSTLDKELP